MRTAFAAVGLAFVGSGSLLAEQAAVQLAEPFRFAYTGEDCTDQRVLACWLFDAGAETKDSSGNGHDLTLRGEARFVPEGRFGGCLESFPAGAGNDREQGAVIKNHPSLTPKGPFTLEAWFKPKPEMNDYDTVFLLDKKYFHYAKDVPEANNDYCLYLRKTGDHHRQAVAYLGYGTDSAAYTSHELELASDTWVHLAFTYDGAGEGRFVFNGRAAGGTVREGRGAVSPGKYDLVLGDRFGSIHHGFPGFLDQVRLCNGVLEFRPATFENVSLRKVFVRREQEASLEFALTNRQRTPLAGAKAHFSLGGMATWTVELPEIASGATHPVTFPLDTSLRPDKYRVSATIELPGDPPDRSTEEFGVEIVPRPLPHRMPVVMWGAGLKEVERLRDLGFTHAIGLGVDQQRIWQTGKPLEAVEPEKLRSDFADLDRALSAGLSDVVSLSPGGRFARGLKQFWRVDAQGKPYEKVDVCGQFPEIRRFCYNVGASVAKVYGSHPAWKAVLIHTEVRGHSQLCYHDHDREACRQALGFDIPAGLQGIRGTAPERLPAFPVNRVVPDDYPPYRFYRWWWKEGDGWNALHTAVHQGIQTAGRQDVWTFHDPAVRVASVFGNGGNVDYLSHWTYSYPDPLRIGLCTDELLAMAAGSPRGDQQVMKMTQIIWYRSQTAPAPDEEAQVQTADFRDHDTRSRGTGSVDGTGTYRAAWEKAIPEARFITIAPMHLREAFWTKIARPIKGIMYHGWQSLVPCPDSTSSYQYTHPETQRELRRLIKTVVEPLGPTLVQVPDRPSDVAFLESFASQMFARRGTYGWNGGWAGDAYLILMYAQLQPQVVYEETVQQTGLDPFKVLVMVDCDVLPQSVVDAVTAWQDKGGILVGDENLCPAIQPDLLLPSHQRPREADTARALLQEKAAALRKQLAPHYQCYAWSTNPDVYTRVRAYRTTDYLFAVNDRREYGDYVGHHGLVMENGLPTETRLEIRRDDVHVYDLVRHRKLSVGGNGATSIPAALGPCEGRLLMVTAKAIGSVRVEASEEAKPGDRLTVEIAVLATDGQPLDAVVPVRVDLVDPHGRPAEFSGYYGAKDGQLTIPAELAANDVPGLWRVRAEELASGESAEAYVRVG